MGGYLSSFNDKAKATVFLRFLCRLWLVVKRVVVDHANYVSGRKVYLVDTIRIKKLCWDGSKFR